MDTVRETYDLASDVLTAIGDTVKAFDAFHRRIRLPEQYRDGEPAECQTPVVLFNCWRKLQNLTGQLEVYYLHDPTSKDAILRAITASPRVAVPPVFNVAAETHVEAVSLIASRICSRLSWICESMGCSFDAIAKQPNFANDCENAADKLRDWHSSSGLLANLRRAVADEEHFCHAFYNPPSVRQVERAPQPKDGWRSANETPSRPPEPKTEGAVSQGVFVYEGKRAEDIQPAPWRLLEFMEDKKEADSEDAYRYAINDDAKDSTETAINSMVRKANAALEEVKHLKRLSKPKNVRKIVWA